MDPNVILLRLKRLAQLDTTVFDEVRDDAREMIPSLIIVVVGSLIAGIGAWLWLALVGHEGLKVDFGNVFVKILLIGTIFNVVLWGFWVAVTYAVLTGYFKEECDIQQLFRTMGYASFPLALTFFMLIPGISFGIGLTALVLWFVMSIYAVQSTTTAHSDHVILSNALGYLVFAVIMSFMARTSGFTTGLFVNTENRPLTAHGAIVEGEYYKLDTGSGRLSGINVP